MRPQQRTGRLRRASVALRPPWIERQRIRRYVFLFFWKDKNPQTDKVWSVFQPAAAKMADWADVVSIPITNPAEKAIVDRYDASRAPMPLVLAIAPCGAITNAYTKTFDEEQLRTAFVSPCTERCLKALQGRKLVLACIVDQASPQDPVAIPKGVADFRADAKFSQATEIVLVNARDQGEATFLKNLQVDPRAQKPVALVRRSTPIGSLSEPPAPAIRSAMSYSSVLLR